MVSASGQHFKATGGLVILKGSLAPEGSVVKMAGHERSKHRGPARVFESEESCLEAILADPAVLRLIKRVVDAAAKEQIEVNVCGEMSGEPLYAPLLVGLGLRQLSATPRKIPEIKRVIRSLRVDQAVRTSLQDGWRSNAMKTKRVRQAIAGVLGSYLIMHPRANVRVAIVFFVFVRIINMPAALVLGVWFLLQIVSGAAVPMSEEGGGVAFWAHVGGFVAGMVLTPVFKRRDVQLLEAPHSRAWEVRPPARRSHLPQAGYRRRDRRSPWE